MLEEVFEPLPDGTNALPSFLNNPVGVLALCGETQRGSRVPNVEVALIDGVLARPGWAAPFLLRSDERSELTVKLCDVEDVSGRTHIRKKSDLVLCPCHFICRVRIEKDRGGWKL